MDASYFYNYIIAHFTKENFKLFPLVYIKKSESNLDFKNLIQIGNKYVSAAENNDIKLLEETEKKLRERIEYEENVIFKMFD